ncbi:hypothetical protein LZ31DRAFT_560507, partial [Colletotrichum somersetense]
VTMRFTTSATLAASLLASSVAGQFCREYTFIDGDSCPKDQAGTFNCKSGNATSIVSSPADGQILVRSTTNNQVGVRVDCGAGGTHTYFIQGSFGITFDQPGCNAKSLAGVVSVTSRVPIPLYYGSQDLTFTDGGACTAQSNGIYLCGDATIQDSNNATTMIAGKSDAAIKVSCDAGSATYFCSAGASTNFTNPVCPDGFTSVTGMKAEATIFDGSD